jgi:hypothetical protein
MTFCYIFHKRQASQLENLRSFAGNLKMLSQKISLLTQMCNSSINARLTACHFTLYLGTGCRTKTCGLKNLLVEMSLPRILSVRVLLSPEFSEPQRAEII